MALIIRAERTPIFKEKLTQIGIGDMTISATFGWSKQRERPLQWRGQPVPYDILPKVKVEIVVADGQIGKAEQAVIESAGIGEQGDSVVFASAIEQAYNVSSLDKGEKITI